jgi:hypothetical protein
MRRYRELIYAILFVAVFLSFATLGYAKDEWLPVTKEDLALKDLPQVAGAHAIILYKADERNDPQGYDEMYYRIKVLTEEGKKYANVETPSYIESIYRIDDVKARTIRPDGTIVPFQAKVFEKLIAKRKGYRVLTKTFTMPDVQVGSIIEYKYKQRFSTATAMYIGNSWRVQDDLFTLKAHFSFFPGPAPLHWIMAGVDKQRGPQEQKDHSITMDLDNIPAFEIEPFMPPENEVRAHVFFYYDDMESASQKIDEYWRKQGKDWRKIAESFMDKRGAMNKEVAAVLKPEDSTTEAKMRRIYDFAQQIRNLTYERSKTDKEEQKENLKDNNNVEDVVKHGYGYHNQINRVYAAMLRSAGIDATLIKVAERDDQFFHRNIPQWGQLTSELVVVNEAGKERYFDPGTLYCPFGALPWEDTGVEGVRIDKDGTSFSHTPDPVSDNSLTSRKAQMQLDREGTLKGTVQLSFTGLEALHRRIHFREDDETQRKKSLEDEVKSWLPAGATVELAKMDGWNSSSTPLLIDLNVTVPNFAAVTGKRMLLPTSIFQGQDRHPFQHAKRISPVYFHFAFREVDDVTITVPEGMQVESVPKPHALQNKFAGYKVEADKANGQLHIRRQFQMDELMFHTQFYEALQQFYNQVKAGDDEQAVLRNVSSAAGK